MPTFSVSGKRQSTVSATVIANDDTHARALFLSRNAGVTGIKIVRKKDVIMAEPTAVTRATEIVDAIIGKEPKKKGSRK